ncbi:hypothetical protein [Nonomuraea dietziae]|uniref:hypothetical protein n=1 Tax=Nonomuraea dietziae TaxID=65515 RepID=UPI0031E278F6
MNSVVRLIRNDRLTQAVDYATTPPSPTRPCANSSWLAGPRAPLDLDGNTVAVGDYAGQTIR